VSDGQSESRSLTGPSGVDQSRRERDARAVSEQVEGVGVNEREAHVRLMIVKCITFRTCFTCFIQCASGCTAVPVPRITAGSKLT